MYRWVDHTGELELAIEAASEAAVFEDAVAAMGELLGEGAGERGADLQEFGIEGADRAMLLAELLGELVFRAEMEGFVPCRLASLDLARGCLTAVVEGRPGNPPHLVKAVTYHRLEFAPTDAGWRATLVFDV